ncbi:hypothetical protein V1507DRAFT_140480 [Lipomyces tetrasporus]
MLFARCLALAAAALSVVAAKPHIHHRHRRAPVAVPEALAEPSAGNCECYTYVTSWLVDYVPTTSSMTTSPTASVESISSVSYTSTDVQYVYVTVYPSWPANSSTSTSSPSSSSDEDVTSTTTVTAIQTSTTTSLVQTTLIITPPATTASTTTSTTSISTPTSTTISSPTSTSTSTWTSTPTTSSTEVDSTSTFFSTVTVFVTVTPVYSTVYTTTTCTPGTHTIGELTTAVTVEETIVVPCSTQTIITVPWPTSIDPAVATSYVTVSPTDDMPLMIVTATVDETVYTTVSCTPGTYTIDGIVTTVTETTAIVATTAPSPTAVLRRRDELKSPGVFGFVDLF